VKSRSETMKPYLLAALAIVTAAVMLCIPSASGNGTEPPEVVRPVEVSVSPGEISTLPGENAVFEYTLTNDNDFFVYVKIVPDRLGAALEGWVLSVKIVGPLGKPITPAPFENGTIVRIEPGERESVFLYVKPPANAGNGSSLTTETQFITLWIRQDLRMESGCSGAGPVVVTVETDDGLSGTMPVVIVASAGIALAALIYGTGTESGRYLLMGFLGAPLYSRINGEKVLDNDLRDDLYHYIVTNPGINFSSLMRELDLKNGTLSHHLRTLERERFIVSRREGAYRRFYPRGVKVAARDMLSSLQKQILEHVRNHAGHTQSLIASDLNCSRQVASYNIGILARSGMIHVERHGRKCFCYPARKVPTAT